MNSDKFVKENSTFESKMKYKFMSFMDEVKDSFK